MNSQTHTLANQPICIKYAFIFILLIWAMFMLFQNKGIWKLKTERNGMSDKIRMNTLNLQTLNMSFPLNIILWIRFTFLWRYTITQLVVSIPSARHWPQGYEDLLHPSDLRKGHDPTSFMAQEWNLSSMKTLFHLAFLKSTGSLWRWDSCLWKSPVVLVTEISKVRTYKEFLKFSWGLTFESKQESSLSP